MPPVMLAAILHRPAPVDESPLALERVPVPRPGPGEVLVRVRCCGVCRTDLHVVEGDLEPRRTPVIPGHQVVGVVEALGPGARGAAVGDRVGVAWLRRTCARCRFCTGGRENLCKDPEFTGWTADGGFAEFVTAPADFVHPIPREFADIDAAPLLCAGIIGYRALRLTGLGERAGGWNGKRLGLYGFGASAHIVIQLARARGAEVFVCTRDRVRHASLAAELGAAWVGAAADSPPAPLDASIIFAPAGELVPPALAALDRGGVLVLAGIHMSDVPGMPYRLLYGERVVRSVANNTRADAREFLEEASRAGVRTRTQAYPLERVGDALRALKHDAVRGAAVVRVSRSLSGA